MSKYDSLDKLCQFSKAHNAALKELWADSKSRAAPTLLKIFVPYDYQLDSLTWLRYLHENKMNGILGDIMGLGKTLQSIMMLANLLGKSTGPFLVVAPLSTTSNWAAEIKKGIPSARYILFTGLKEQKEEMKENIVSFIMSQPKADRKDPKLNFDIMVTTPDILLNEAEFLCRFKWRYLVFDEAHRLKNSDGTLYTCLTTNFEFHGKLLLTGTPIQNNLKELWSLLHFVMPNVFPSLDTFIEWFGSHSSKDLTAMNKENLPKLHDILRVFMLRRTLADANLNLPLKKEVVIYAGMSKLQKEYYRHVLTKDANALGSGNSKSLLNIVMGLRKACSHPYMFDGAEKEPYVEGDHIFENSGKLSVLEKLLAKLHRENHRVLIFCQFTQMIDILQDFLAYKNYKHERLDGSTSTADRGTIIDAFNGDKSIFALLLSTRSGGQGLNLTGADTVIFYESDWNPQMDVQAAARVYRIGQSKPVEIIRLITKNAIDEVIWKRSQQKLRLSKNVIDDASLVPESSNQPNIGSKELKAMIQFGLEELLRDDEDVDQAIEKILERAEEVVPLGHKPAEEDRQSVADVGNTDFDESNEASNSIYFYEGRDFSKDALALSKIVGTSSPRLLPDIDVVSRKRKILTEEEKEERARSQQERKQQKLQEAEIKKLNAQAQKWKTANYQSHSIVLPDAEDEDEENMATDDGDVEDNQNILNFVVGDASKPIATQDQAAIILTCIDDSGNWPGRGFFGALDKLSPAAKEQYEFAGKMDDLNLGDAHMTDQIDTLNGPVFVIHMIVQHRSLKGARSDISMKALGMALEKIAYVAKQIKASVHAPRLGSDSASNWYGVKKLITKNLVDKGVPTYVYYFRSKMPTTTHTPLAVTRDTSDEPSSSSAPSSSAPTQPRSAPSEKESKAPVHKQQSAGSSGPLSGCVIHLYELSANPKAWIPVAKALGAELCMKVSSKTTHLVTDLVCLDKHLRTMMQEHPTLVVVQSPWLSKCYELGEEATTSAFEVPDIPDETDD